MIMNLHMSRNIVLHSSLFAILMCSCLLIGCKSSQPANSAIERYQRTPIAEADPAQLELQNMLTDAKLQQELGNSSQAISLYRKVLAKDPSYSAACYEMGRLLASQLRLDSAIIYCERAVKADPTNVWYRLECATLYKSTNQGDKLTGEWEAIVKQNPTVLEYYYELSNSYLLTGDYKNAINALDRVEKIIGVTEPISLQKQKIWSAAGENKKANMEIERLAGAMPHDAKYNSILAESYMKAGNYDKAKACYDKVLAADPDNEYIHISLAQYYKAVGDQENAYKELKKGFANPALTSETKVQLLTSFYSREDFYDKYSKYSYDLLDDAMSSSKDSTAYALLYGDVLMRQNKYAEAARQFKTYIAKDSSQYDVWEALLVCESELEGNDEEMLSYARRAASLFPLNNLPRYLQGVYAYTHKNYEEAVNQLAQCEKIGFSKGYLQSETYSLLADSYHALGKDDMTFAYYDKLLKLNPNNAIILNNYAYYLSEQSRRLEDALTMIEKAVKQEPDNSTYLDTYAWTLYKMKRYAEARTQMQKCMANDKKHSETLKQHWEIIRSAK